MKKYLILLCLLMASPAWGALALDGASTSTTATSGSATSTVSTTGPGVIFFVVQPNTVTVSSVSGATLGAFTQRESQLSGGNNLYVFYKYSSGAVTNELITATLSGSSFWSASSFGVSGVPATNFFDVNAGVPNKGTTDPRTVSTTAANTFIFGAFRMNSTQNPTVGSGWTVITAGNYLITEYKIVSAPQTSLSVTLTTGAGDANGAIADAVVAVSRRSMSSIIFQ